MRLPRFSMGAHFLTLAIATVFLSGPAAYGSNAVIHNFTGATSDGGDPAGSLIFDAAGNLYGTTFTGGNGVTCGTTGCGTVFRLTPSGGSWTESVIYNFQGAADGVNPLGALIADAAGNLYGVTQGGGIHGFGTVYKLTPGSGGSWTESVLYAFGAISLDGISPAGKMAFDASGNLWGVTQSGGKHSGGTVFELVPSGASWTETQIYSFQRAGTKTGNEPSGIIFDSAGNLYGVTLFGGTPVVNGAGVVFQLVQSSGVWTEVDIHTFPVTGSSLQTPTGGLVLDGAGNLYMTMSRGGRGGAGVSKINLATHVLTDLYSFPGGQVLSPYEGLVFDSAGNLYSASNTVGGNCINGGCGFVYELSPGTPRWTATKLASFNGPNGANPAGGVILDSAGNLFGTASIGGSTRFGVVYKVTP